MGGTHKFEAYEDYVPTDNFFSQALRFPNYTRLSCRSFGTGAMVIAGEADWAADIGFENKTGFPSRQPERRGGFLLVFDTFPSGTGKTESS
ncbi:MAG: hypothetical protein CM1200mP35_10380 [Chloroflexota bacterium]|nr:MAG: hypothetical protein CM1200mP35_10380 [Chloroflexota bacterium]